MSQQLNPTRERVQRSPGPALSSEMTGPDPVFPRLFHGCSTAVPKLFHGLSTMVPAVIGRSSPAGHSDAVSLRPLSELCFAVVDLETTGLSPRIEHVIELSISVQQEGRELKSFQSLMGPAVPVPAFITRLTGLRERDLQTAPLFADIVNAVAHCFVGVGSADREREQKSSFAGGAARPSLEKAPCSSYPRAGSAGGIDGQAA